MIGNTLTGFYSVLDQNGVSVATGFSPAIFTVEGGQAYSVEVQNFANCVFDHWTDTGSTDGQRTFTAASTAQTFTAVYNCGTSVGGASTISVSGVDSAGNAITGYYVTLWQNGVQLKSCFFPCSFTVSSGTYQVAVADFGSHAFTRWTDGTTTRFHTIIVASASTAISITAVYT